MFYRLYDYRGGGGADEVCYYIESTRELSDVDYTKLCSIISTNLKTCSSLIESSHHFVLEIGPRLHFQSVWASNVKSILDKVGLDFITRMEHSNRYLLKYDEPIPIQVDKMIETIYPHPLSSFEHTRLSKKNLTNVDITKLRIYSEQNNLGFDQSDIDLYKRLYKELGRNPTNVELFDLAQSNSEHSRHHTFRGNLYIEVPRDKDDDNGREFLRDPCSLMDHIKKPLKSSNTNQNSVVGIGNFPDNSSAIRGEVVSRLQVSSVNGPSKLKNAEIKTNTLFTAETHNFPTGIAPFPGAATGTGGRIRDVQAIGRGGQFVAGTAGYAVGCLGLSSVKEIEQSLNENEYLNTGWKILKEASDGASDYGNKIGEPLIQGWCRSFGSDFMVKVPEHRRLIELRRESRLIENSDLSLSASGNADEDDAVYIKRIEWIKPIMFSGGIGAVYDEHLYKVPPAEGMLILRVGGPAYRIGIGGGSASSTSQTNEDKYVNAIQRGDPQLENRLDRFIRACVSLGVDNPILSIHDQGAGGMANVTKEIVESKGGIVDLANMYIGDSTMTSEELWVAEYQEQNTFLAQSPNLELLQSIARREEVDLRVVGVVTNDNRFTVIDSRYEDTKFKPIVDFPLDKVLHTPPKAFFLPLKDQVIKTRVKKEPIGVATDYENKIRLVFKNVAVSSKRFLTNKVDRSVSGLIAQQQCVGAIHTPISNVAVISHSFFDNVGAATAIGERAIVGITHPERMARLAVGEMLTNVMWAPISSIKDIKCSVNWMWPAKSNTEKRRLYDAVKAISAVMCKIGIAIDGGKDSLSMSAKTKTTSKTVDSPPQVVVSGYVNCVSLTSIVTPDFKKPGSRVIYVDLGDSRYRLGGSVYAMTFTEQSNQKLSTLYPSDVVDVPTLNSASVLVSVFEVIQTFIKKGLILSGHDRSDGGLITTISEMCIAGCLGCDLFISTLSHDVDTLLDFDRFMFSEELGFILEVDESVSTMIVNTLQKTGVFVKDIGSVTLKDCVSIQFGNGVESSKSVTNTNVSAPNNNSKSVNISVSTLRKYWEDTSFEMEKLQSNVVTVSQEMEWQSQIPIGFSQLRGDLWTSSLKYCPDKLQLLHSATHVRRALNIPGRMKTSPRIAIIRAQGSNGDREMGAAFWMAGFDVWDVTMSDLMEKRISLNDFRGVAFVGGFSFADVLGSANGWASIIEYTPHLQEQFAWFLNRHDTFSLGVCNGFQLVARLGWLGHKFTLLPNVSGRFESRFVDVRITSGESMWLRGLDGVTFGMWVAHGEGRLTMDDAAIDSKYPIRYVDPLKGEISELYPCNPNGSEMGVAGMMSNNGRHFGLMPHPERCVLKWQLPWCPESLKENRYTPWMKIFQNAYEWVIEC